MSRSVLRGGIARGVLMGGASLFTAMATASIAQAQSLRSTYSPNADNGGGSSPGRADIITVDGTTSIVGGNYNLLGTSGRRFNPVVSTLAQQNQSGNVISGYDGIAGRVSVPLTPTQKRGVATYPDQITGTTVATPVYDNALLGTVNPTAQATFDFRDTGAPVYGDLRLADIRGSVVTIATGDKTRSVYDRVNAAVTTSDSGSTLYNVTGGSTVTYDARTSTMSGRDLAGFSQSASQSYGVPVTTFSGVAFGSGDSVTDLDSLKRYNSALIGQLQAGQITPTQYDNLINAAASTSNRTVVVAQQNIPPFVPRRRPASDCSCGSTIRG